MQKGYIAISSILVISAVVLAITVSVSHLAIGEGQIALSLTKAEQRLAFQESCIEDILLRFRSGTSPVAGSMPEGTCIIYWSDTGNGNYTFAIQTPDNTYGKYFTVSANRDYSVSVTSWQQTY